MIFTLTFRHICLATSSLPLIALLICVLLCLFTNSCIKTHCTDTNILPSLSAAVGDDQPQKTIWTLSVLISSAWRLLILPNHYINLLNLFSSFTRQGRLYLCNSLCLSNFIEIVSLNMLSIVSSSDDYIRHRNYFGIFVLSSVVYMIIDVYISQLINKLCQYSPWSKILKKKIYVMATYVTCLLIIMLCHYIHMRFCPPYTYTVFAVFEYVAIISNVTYHYTTSQIYEDISIKKIISYFSSGRTIPFVDMKLELPLLEAK
nr:SJCHGC03563 protein [Schistosoma japonicum]